MSQTIINQQSVINNTAGTRVSRLCKPVINLTTGAVYKSSVDAAEILGVGQSTVSAACLGKINTCKGYHLAYVEHTSENVDTLTAQIRILNEHIKTLEADAALGRKVREEQEAARRAEEARQKQLEALREKLARGEARELKMHKEADVLIAKLNDRIERNEAIRKAIAELEGAE